jgi:hypothetical protein
VYVVRFNDMPFLDKVAGAGVNVRIAGSGSPVST